MRLSPELARDPAHTREKRKRVRDVDACFGLSNQKVGTAQMPGNWKVGKKCGLPHGRQNAGARM